MVELDLYRWGIPMGRMINGSVVRTRKLVA